MKISFLIPVLLITIACSREELPETVTSETPDLVLKNSKNQDDLSLDFIKNSGKAYTLKETQDLIEEEFKDYKKVESKSLEFDFKDANIDQSKMAGWVGPLNATGVKTRIRKNHKMVLAKGDGGLATGVYFCDIYSFKATISLPLNSVGRVDIPSPVGYNNLIDQNLGVTSYQNSGPTKNEFIVYTLMIHVRSNVLGQSLSVKIPSSLQRVNYKYYYLKY